MIVKLPAVSGVTVTSVVLPGGISVSNLNGFDMKPCTRSLVVRRRITGSPFLSVISLGVNSNFFAVISITLGLSLARVRLVSAGTPTSPISHTPASRIVRTILLIAVFFIFLLVLSVCAAVFEHLIHSNRAREIGACELDFLELQIVAVRGAVHTAASQVLDRVRVVETH